MTMLRIFTLLGLLLAMATSALAQDSGSPVAITLQRTACFGACPVYTVSILEDGTVIYNGERFVELTGEQRSEIDPAMVAMMVETFEAAGYFDWDTAYDEYTVSDLPTVISSVTRNGETHQISRYEGDSSAPLALPFLESWIDAKVNTQQWTGFQPDFSGMTMGMNNPLATLQREPCFGMCPVYSVAVYADGTVVYTGIAHVAQLGVKVLQLEPAAVSSITARAEGSGYFNFEDNYNTRTITDQATITTSIQTDDQFKRIVRYAGDASAPVGLTWVEASIEILVQDLVG